jgi:hypothetical protein
MTSAPSSITGPLLLAVDGFGDHGGAMADEPGDIRRGRGE